MREGIPTEYKHYRFRSRLEATWARFFDLVEWPWKYEPFDYDGYIPDFVLLFPAGEVLVEVKPELSCDGLRDHISKIDKSPWKKECLLLGVGLIESQTETFPHYIGLIGCLDYNPDSRVWEPATIHHCGDHIGFQPADGGWVCRYRKGWPLSCLKDPRKEWFESRWAMAQNLVQWAPKTFGIDL